MRFAFESSASQAYIAKTKMTLLDLEYEMTNLIKRVK